MRPSAATVRSKDSRRRHGLATIELAFVLPLLLLILAAVVDFGRVGYHRCILASAAEHAASLASHNPPAPDQDPSEWLAKIEAAAAEDLAQLAGSSPDALEVHAACTKVAGVDCVEVEVRYPFETWFAWPVMDRSVVFSEVAVRPVDQ